jgi:hypothetical protein
MSSAIKSTIEKILWISLHLIIYTDSKSLYDCLIKLRITQEKRLIIDLMCLCQLYKRREITEVKWINGSTNPADTMTKLKACSALKDLINTNKVNITCNEWVERWGRNFDQGIGSLLCIITTSPLLFILSLYSLALIYFKVGPVLVQLILATPVYGFG